MKWKIIFIFEIVVILCDDVIKHKFAVVLNFPNFGEFERNFFEVEVWSLNIMIR